MDGTDPTASDRLTFARDGAQRIHSALDSAALSTIAAALPALAPDRAGARLHGIAALRPILASSGPVGAVAASVLGSGCRPVRTILFDKTAAMNWSLGWHQDRTIAVVTRIEVEGFGPWTVKNGIPHVAPPFALLAHRRVLQVDFAAGRLPGGLKWYGV